MIRVERLRKVFLMGRRHVVAVEDASFAVGPRQIVGLLGPNGAGKTTTLRLIATILAPTSGMITVDGFDVVREPGKVRSRLGFLTGDTGLYERLTVRETLVHFARLQGVTSATAASRIVELAQVFGLERILDRRVGQLSTGLKQRVSLARTMVHDPPVVVLDEPMMALDIVTSRNTVEFLRRSRAAGKCILLSTHTMADAEMLCDELVLLDRGRVIAAGTTGAVLDSFGKKDLQEVFLGLAHDENI